MTGYEGHEKWLTEFEIAKKYLIIKPPRCICGEEYDRFKKDGDVIMARCPECWHIRYYYIRAGRWGGISQARGYNIVKRVEKTKYT